MNYLQSVQTYVSLILSLPSVKERNEERVWPAIRIR